MASTSPAPTAATPDFDVFLSHNSADKPAVRHLKEQLTKRRISCWFDEADLRSGADWTTRLEDGMRRSRCCAIFYGPAGIGPWHEMERQLAQLMAAEAWRDGQHFGIIPVRLPDAPDWRKLTLPPFLRLYTSVDFPSLSDDAALNRLEAGIRDEAPPPVELDPARAPYIGMRPFTEADTTIFTGRNNYIIDLAGQLQRARAPRFLAVLGASGSGKSSLLQAGLLPRLRQGALHPETKNWLYVTFRPGSNALSNLEAALRGQPALLPHVPAPGGKMEDRKAQWPDDRLHQVAMSALGNQHGGPRLLVIVDQFEELFTFRPSGESPAEEKRRNDYLATVWEPFVRNLAFAASDASGPVSVIVSMRADFLGQFSDDEKLRAFLAEYQHRCLIQPLSEREVRASIERPAVARGLQFDAALVETVVQDYQLDPAGALPFLQEALLRVWEKGGRKELSLADYQEFGGLRGAVNAQADRVLEGFKKVAPAKAALIPQLFVYLTRLADDGGPDTKRRRRLEDLPGGEPVQALAQELATAEHRLLVLDQAPVRIHATPDATTAPDPAAAPAPAVPDEFEATVEIAHESLLVGWKELKNWLNDKQRPDRLRLRRLESEARAWEDEDEAPNALLLGPELRRAEQLCRTFAAETPQVVERFVRDSRKATNLRWLRNSGYAAAAAAMIFAAAFFFSSARKGGGPPEDPLPGLRQKLEEDAKRSDYPAIIIDAPRVIELDPHDRGARALLVRALIERGNFTEAEKQLGAWQEHAPADTARIDELRGDQAAAQGNKAGAIASWTIAAEGTALETGRRIALWRKLAAAQYERHEWEEAERWLSQLISTPDDIVSRLQRCEAYRQLALWTKAEADLKYLRDTDPSHPEVKKIRDLSAEAQRADEEISEQLRYDKQNTDLYLKRARVRIEAQAFAAAHADLEKAQTVPTTAGLADGWRELAAAYRQAGRNDSATIASQRAQELSSQPPPNP